MNILVVSHNIPRPTWGAGARNYHLLRTLARHHEVSLLALVDEHEANRFDTRHLDSYTRCRRLVPLRTAGYKRLHQVTSVALRRSHLLSMYSSPRMQAALDELLHTTPYDVVLFEGLIVADHKLPPHTRMVIDEHNIEHEILRRTVEQTRSPLRRWYNSQEYRRLKPAELALCRRADAVLVTSERERALLASALPATMLRVVPNGVDTAAFSPPEDGTEMPGRVVFTGMMSYYPNTHAVLRFAQYCWPFIRSQVPYATWQIVGSNPPPEVQRLAELPGVEVTGSVPAIQPYLAQAAVAIAPIDIGSGTRLKILEALAMGKAVVSTSVGCEGLDVTAGEHLLTADDLQEFACAVSGLLQDPSRRGALGHAGRALVEQRYSWDTCGAPLLSVLETLRQAEAV
jgi:polysaccharide biosynthesis protein PslH